MRYILLCAALLPSVVATTASAQVDPRLAAAADSFLAAGRVPGPPGPWPDMSDATRLATYQRQDELAASLSRIDPATLRTAQDRLLFANLFEINDARRGSRVCRYHLWNGTSPFAGWHVSASNSARGIAVSSARDRETALANFTRLPAAIRAERAMLARGLDSGSTASRAVVQAVVRQLDDLLPADVGKSPLHAPAERDASGELAPRWRALLVDSIYPAATAYRDWLRDVYAPAARAEGSLRALPDGAACYQADLRLRTSVRADPDSLMRDARREYDRIARELLPLVRQLTGEPDIGRGVIALRTDPRFTFPSRDSVLAAYRAMTKVAESRVPRVVAGVAPESLAVLPYAAFQENAGLPPQYQRASGDGSRPAQFLVNLGRTERMSVANAVAHEAYPGHHLQRIAEARATVVHPVMRSLGVGAFVEGWGIYSEVLGDEMDLYPTPLDRAGYLVHILDVAVAMYLDVGMHVKGWSRQTLVDSMVVLGGRPPVMAANYADRHAATPGQLATYYVGYRAIQAARDAAQRALGTKFNSPAFHAMLLGDGPITLASMREKVDLWIRARQ